MGAIIVESEKRQLECYGVLWKNQDYFGANAVYYEWVGYSGVYVAT